MSTVKCRAGSSLGGEVYVRYSAKRCTAAAGRTILPNFAPSAEKTHGAGGELRSVEGNGDTEDSSPSPAGIDLVR